MNRNSATSSSSNSGNNESTRSNCITRTSRRKKKRRRNLEQSEALGSTLELQRRATERFGYSKKFVCDIKRLMTRTSENGKERASSEGEKRSFKMLKIAKSIKLFILIGVIAVDLYITNVTLTNKNGRLLLPAAEAGKSKSSKASKTTVIAIDGGGGGKAHPVPVPWPVVHCHHHHHHLKYVPKPILVHHWVKKQKVPTYEFAASDHQLKDEHQIELPAIHEESHPIPFDFGEQSRPMPFTSWTGAATMPLKSRRPSEGIEIDNEWRKLKHQSAAISLAGSSPGFVMNANNNIHHNGSSSMSDLQQRKHQIGAMVAKTLQNLKAGREDLTSGTSFDADPDDSLMSVSRLPTGAAKQQQAPPNDNWPAIAAGLANINATSGGINNTGSNNSSSVRVTHPLGSSSSQQFKQGNHIGVAASNFDFLSDILTPSTSQVRGKPNHPYNEPHDQIIDESRLSRSVDPISAARMDFMAKLNRANQLEAKEAGRAFERMASEQANRLGALSINQRLMALGMRPMATDVPQAFPLALMPTAPTVLGQSQQPHHHQQQQQQMTANKISATTIKPLGLQPAAISARMAGAMSESHTIDLMTRMAAQLAQMEARKVMAARPLTGEAGPAGNLKTGSDDKTQAGAVVEKNSPRGLLKGASLFSLLGSDSPSKNRNKRRNSINHLPSPGYSVDLIMPKAASSKPIATNNWQLQQQQQQLNSQPAQLQSFPINMNPAIVMFPTQTSLFSGPSSMFLTPNQPRATPLNSQHMVDHMTAQASTTVNQIADPMETLADGALATHESPAYGDHSNGTSSRTNIMSGDQESRFYLSQREHLQRLKLEQQQQQQLDMAAAQAPTSLAWHTNASRMYTSQSSNVHNSIAEPGQPMNMTTEPMSYYLEQTSADPTRQESAQVAALPTDSWPPASNGDANQGNLVAASGPNLWGSSHPVEASNSFEQATTITGGNKAAESPINGAQLYQQFVEQMMPMSSYLEFPLSPQQWSAEAMKTMNSETTGSKQLSKAAPGSSGENGLIADSDPAMDITVNGQPVGRPSMVSASVATAETNSQQPAEMLYEIMPNNHLFEEPVGFAPATASHHIASPFESHHQMSHLEQMPMRAAASASVGRARKEQPAFGSRQPKGQPSAFYPAKQSIDPMLDVATADMNQLRQFQGALSQSALQANNLTAMTRLSRQLRGQMLGKGPLPQMPNIPNIPQPPQLPNLPMPPPGMMQMAGLALPFAMARATRQANRQRNNQVNAAAQGGGSSAGGANAPTTGGVGQRMFNRALSRLTRPRGRPASSPGSSSAASSALASTTSLSSSSSSAGGQRRPLASRNRIFGLVQTMVDMSKRPTSSPGASRPAVTLRPKVASRAMSDDYHRSDTFSPLSYYHRLAGRQPQATSGATTLIMPGSVLAAETDGTPARYASMTAPVDQITMQLAERRRFRNQRSGRSQPHSPTPRDPYQFEGGVSDAGLLQVANYELSRDLSHPPRQLQQPHQRLQMSASRQSLHHMGPMESTQGTIALTPVPMVANHINLVMFTAQNVTSSSLDGMQRPQQQPQMQQQDIALPTEDASPGSEQQPEVGGNPSAEGEQQSSEVENAVAVTEESRSETENAADKGSQQQTQHQEQQHTQKQVYGQRTVPNENYKSRQIGFADEQQQVADATTQKPQAEEMPPAGASISRSSGNSYSSSLSGSVPDIWTTGRPATTALPAIGSGSSSSSSSTGSWKATVIAPSQAPTFTTSVARVKSKRSTSRPTDLPYQQVPPEALTPSRSTAPVVASTTAIATTTQAPSTLVATSSTTPDLLSASTAETATSGSVEQLASSLAPAADYVRALKLVRGVAYPWPPPTKSSKLMFEPGDVATSAVAATAA